MAAQGSYPLNGRTLAATDTLTGVVTGATADVPVSALAPVVAVLVQAQIVFPVTTVFGRAGAVVAQTGDYTASQVTNAAATTGTLAQFAATTSAQLAGVLTDETGTGSAVFGTGPTISQPNIVGVTANSNATAGSVGEFVSATVLSSAPVSLVSGTPVNVTSVSLTAGDWDVRGTIGFVVAGTTTTSQQIGWISTVSATLPSAPNSGAFISFLNPAGGAAGGGVDCYPVGMLRVSVAATTTVYLGAQSSFSTSTASAYGFLGARRVR